MYFFMYKWKSPKELYVQLKLQIANSIKIHLDI